MLYVMLGLAGPRFGMAAAGKWEHYDPAEEPLGKLVFAFAWNVKEHCVTRVKTKVPCEVPVHPALAPQLKWWREKGWPWMMGRKPRPEDLIVPSRKGQHRNVNHGLRKFYGDLERLGLRARHQHDMRRSFITLAQKAGANRDVLKTITHAARGQIMDLYTAFDWETKCEEVAKLKLDLHDRRTPAWKSSPVWQEWLTIRDGEWPEQGVDQPIETTWNSNAASCSLPADSGIYVEPNEILSGVDGTRTRGLRRDRPAL
jgi:hypothetical protein